MRILSIELILRANGFFHFKDRLIPAIRRGSGYGVLVIFEPSPLDVDMGGLSKLVYKILKFANAKFHFFISSKEYKELGHKLEETDPLTYNLIGHGWDHGPRPYQPSQKLADLL